MSDVVHNERTKLLAAALNTACTSCVTVGIATPLAGYLYDVSSFRSTIGLTTLAVGLVGWLAAAVALHLTARKILGELR